MSEVRWSRSFPGKPEQVRAARRFVTGLLEDMPAVAVVELLVSELATNAVEHTGSGAPGGEFVVSLVFDPDRVRLAVADQGSSHTPLRGAGGDCDEDGRGLLIVAGYAKSWGITGDDQGRVVWAELSTHGEL